MPRPRARIAALLLAALTTSCVASPTEEAEPPPLKQTANPLSPAKSRPDLRGPIQPKPVVGHQDYSSDFAAYRAEAHFKAFAVGGESLAEAKGFGSSWAGGSLGEAIEAALESCDASVGSGECRLYSIGNILVSGMTAAELDRAKAAYIADPDATNDDLQ